MREAFLPPRCLFPDFRTWGSARLDRRILARRVCVGTMLQCNGYGTCDRTLVVYRLVVQPMYLGISRKHLPPRRSLGADPHPMGSRSLPTYVRHALTYFVSNA